ncbi:MAG: presenilin family intramembrane aspartyl protease [Patescibacteria group bacterium]
MSFNLNNFWRVLVPFVATQALGFYAAWRFLPEVIAVKPVDLSSFSWIDLLIFIAFIFVFFLFATKFKRVGASFYKIFLSLIIFSGSQAIFAIWFTPVITVIVATALIVIFWLHQSVIVQNIAMILTIAGIGAVIGVSLLPISVVYILVAFSVYDIIAVYKTGHMIKMANAMIESRAIFGFVIPEPGRTVRAKISGITPGQGFMILGSGDVIFPLLLSASLVRDSLTQASVVMVFSALGLFLMYLIFSNQQVRRPMAALPPIALITIVGYLISTLFL